MRNDSPEALAQAAEALARAEILAQVAEARAAEAAAQVESARADEARAAEAWVNKLWARVAEAEARAERLEEKNER